MEGRASAGLSHLKNGRIVYYPLGDYQARETPPRSSEGVARCYYRGKVPGKPCEGKPPARFDEGLIGYQDDGLLERDTRPERGETSKAHIACTLLHYYSTLQSDLREL